ncbi:MAG: nucleotidyltransferase family protein [Nitrospirota bacterium]
MKAILLAAGKGERLAGVLKNLPKPMVEIAGRPILEHNINLLKQYGFVDIYMNLHHCPEVIERHFGDGKAFGVHITYSREADLLGTAGGARKIADTLWATPARFILLYGDNLFQCDLSKIVAAHDVKKGIGTIGLHEREDVRQSGVVFMGQDHRIVQFVEKPGTNEIESHMVNAAVYVLEPAVLDFIPKETVFDFGKDVFPELLRQGKALYGTRLDGDLTAIDTPTLLEAARGKPIPPVSPLEGGSH